MRIATAAALAVMMGGSAALAQGGPPRTEDQMVSHVETVRDLASVCDPRWSDVPRLEAIAYCQGFLTGVGQYYTLTHPRGRSRQLYCVSASGASIAESGLGFARWARENPTYANEPALDGYLRWAQQRHPCAPQARNTMPQRPAR
jgi:hypothetical protein